ncbi:MAG: histidine--tRNA ligase [Dehalococcoidia bacterium]|uniref:histidine--tRNA ligase n=1 Tax=Candidatus Amarobacter glycogenicus TaxID=3140699 RepID=UPI003136E949|nr:histidine--tRNA ligase [Dehalococcoidia bacterium]MBK9344236.1 histidine--tRNA ligase [Dehalococcoidia bacterium]
MTTRFQAPRGTQDVLPDMQPYWQAVNDAIRVVTRLHGFRRIDTPAFEYAGVFEKGSGDTTDIVEKEMYTFEDRGGEKLALTPEGTPAICRAYLEHGMASWPQPVRLYTTHQMFRYDRPQKGRYRQHTQFDCEIFGSTDPLVDAEVIAVLWRLYTMLGIRNAGVRLGSLDDIAPRRAYVERLKDYYRPHLPKLSEDSQRRFERNPLRLLDSKDERDLPFKEAAPKLVDNLSPEARAHHETVLGALEATEIPVEIDPLLVRGLDYYNRTVFEIVPTDDARAQGTIGGGGRYDGLMEILGGPPTPGMGFGSGIERIILEMQRSGVVFENEAAADVYIVHKAEGAAAVVFGLASRLRSAGVAAVLGESNKSFKAQMRGANHSGAKFAIIIGDDELARGAGTVKDLTGEGEQESVELGRLPALLAAKLRA